MDQITTQELAGKINQYVEDCSIYDLLNLYNHLFKDETVYIDSNTGDICKDSK